MEHPNTLRPPNLAARLLGCGFAAMALTVTPLHAAQTDISSTPITSANSAQVKPNIMLLMDTSGSMGWGHMPDEVETQVGINAVGYKAAQCNVLYYNPFTSYQLPKLASGAFFPAPNFNGGLYDAYDSASIVPPVDLSSLFKAYDDLTLRTSGYNDTPQPAYYYWHTGGGAIANYTATTCTDADTGGVQDSEHLV